MWDKLWYVKKKKFPFLAWEVQRMTRDCVPSESISAPRQLYIYFPEFQNRLFSLLRICKYPVFFLPSFSLACTSCLWKHWGTSSAVICYWTWLCWTFVSLSSLLAKNQAPHGPSWWFNKSMKVGIQRMLWCWTKRAGVLFPCQMLVGFFSFFYFPSGES